MSEDNEATGGLPLFTGVPIHDFFKYAASLYKFEGSNFPKKLVSKRASITINRVITRGPNLRVISLVTRPRGRTYELET